MGLRQVSVWPWCKSPCGPEVGLPVTARLVSVFLTLDEFLLVSLESSMVGLESEKRVGPSGTMQAYLICKVSYFCC